MGKKLFSVMAVALSAAVVLTACSSTADTTNAADTASVPAGGEVERGASLSQNRGVAIANNTDQTITLSITETDNFDWESRRPDHPAPEGFQGAVLAPGETLTRWLNRNLNATHAPFMVNFGDTGASVRLNIKQDYDTKDTDQMPPYLDTYQWGGWNMVGTSYCEKKSVESAGYQITTQCEFSGLNLTPSGVNTTVTITK
jgi:hypothetical protein